MLRSHYAVTVTILTSMVTRLCAGISGQTPACVHSRPHAPGGTARLFCAIYTDYRSRSVNLLPVFRSCGAERVQLSVEDYKARRTNPFQCFIQLHDTSCAQRPIISNPIHQLVVVRLFNYSNSMLVEDWWGPFCGRGPLPDVRTDASERSSVSSR